MTDHREPPPISSEELPHVVASLQAQSQAQLEEKEAKALLEITTKTFDRSTAYANVILVAGYAGAFTIWSFTRQQLSARAGIGVALSLLISLAAFVTFEVVKMTITSRVVLRNAKVLRGEGEAAKKLEALKAIENAHTSTLMKFSGYWIGTMVIAVGGATVALALLAWNFVAFLLGWTGWP